MQKTKNKLIEENKKEFNHWNEKIQDKEGLEYTTRWFLDKKTLYVGTEEEQRKKALKAIDKKLIKRLTKSLKELNEIMEAEPLPNHLIISVEWKKSKMWGWNPKAYDNYNKESESISGCGYDKLSTATSQILNQHPILIKEMIQKLENEVLESDKRDRNTIYREVLGYGAGYGIIPHFEGGVGVSCHLRILERLGYDTEHHSTPNTDTIIIKKRQDKV